MYQNNKSTYSMPFCGLTLKLYETGKKAPSYEYSASLPIWLINFKDLHIATIVMLYRKSVGQV